MAGGGERIRHLVKKRKKEKVLGVSSCGYLVKRAELSDVKEPVVSCWQDDITDMVIQRISEQIAHMPCNKCN